MHKRKRKTVRLGKKKKNMDNIHKKKCLCVIMFNDVGIYILNLKYWYHFDDDLMKMKMKMKLNYLIHYLMKNLKKMNEMLIDV